MTISTKCGKLLKQNAPVCGTNSATTAQKIRACVRKQFRHDGAQERACGGIGSFSSERALRAMKRGLKKRRNNEKCDQRKHFDYVSSCLAQIIISFFFCLRLCAEVIPPQSLITLAPVAELADAQDLGSCVNSCRFDPCQAHQTYPGRAMPFPDMFSMFVWVANLLKAKPSIICASLM